MDNKKIIKIMENMKFHAERTDDKELIEACDGAIKAIKDNIKLKEAWEKVREDIHNFNGMDTYVCGDGLYKWIKAKDIVESINKHLGEVEK